jgi:hypothetical protein
LGLIPGEAGLQAPIAGLAQLLELNLAVAQRLEKAEPVTPPGIPATFPNPESLITDDCIRSPGISGSTKSGQE